LPHPLFQSSPDFFDDFNKSICSGPPVFQDSVVVRSLDRYCRAPRSRPPSPATGAGRSLSDRETPRSAQPATFHLSDTTINIQTTTKMACDYQYVKEHTREDYVFPSHRFQRTCSPDKTPLCLVACGSFSPITFLQYVLPAQSHSHPIVPFDRTGLPHTLNIMRNYHKSSGL
jgi:hypothetical protein